MMSLFWLSVLALLLSAPVQLYGNHNLSRQMVELGLAVWCGLLLVFVFFAAFVDTSGSRDFLGIIDFFVLLGPMALWRMGLTGLQFPLWYAHTVHAIVVMAVLSGSITLLLSERRQA